MKSVREEGLGEARDSGGICFTYDDLVALHGDVYNI